ncbi:MAG: TolC family protein [Bacteroidetes bacterium]|nr:TolC family protein [Bacteroidota bacterium]
MNNKIFKTLVAFSLLLVFAGCQSINVSLKTEVKSVPSSFNGSADSANTSNQKRQDFFQDPFLIALIDSALNNNQELNILLQEIQMANNEVMAKKGAYLPSVGVGAGASLDKVGRYTSTGASEANTEIVPGRAMPDPVPNFGVGAFAEWEVDIWNKLRNSKKATTMRYLSTVEGKNFMVTHLVAEIANAYYELLAFDKELLIVQQNIQIQTNALEIVKLQKEAARVTELAVRKFEAQLLYTQSLQYEIQQKIVESENQINFLVGRFPQTIERTQQEFNDLPIPIIQVGTPEQLLSNRPDILRAELNLNAAKLDVKSARANFYPSLRLESIIGLQAFNPVYWAKAPESILFSLMGGLMGPVINRNEIKALYYSSNSKQIQAVYEYQKTILNAYIDVVNQVAKVNNLEKSYALKLEQVKVLTESIQIANDLFKFARANYIEVLMTQRDALESRFDLVETKKQQLLAVVNTYRALGGGWR